MSKRPREHRLVQRIGRELDGNRCGFCGEKHPGKMEGHHIIEYHEGGPAMVENIMAACRDCHVAYHKGEFDVDIVAF